MYTLYTIFIVVFLFGLSVFVHELGHFIAARQLGLVIDVFSIGFGPAILKRKVGNVLYKVGCLPFGGYVALPQLDHAASQSEKDKRSDERQLPRIAPWKKIIVAFAGATGNIILAIILAYIIYAFGQSQQRETQGCVIGYVETNSAAYNLGIRVGDKVLSANGEKIDDWDNLVVAAALTENVDLQVIGVGGQQKHIKIPTEKWPIGGRGIYGVLKSSPCLVIGVRANSSAEKAGILRKDVITEINGITLYSREQLIELVDKYRDQDVPVQVLRGKETITLKVKPEYYEAIGRALIGVEFNPIDIYKRPWAQMHSWASPVFRLLLALVTPSESRHAASAVGGPVAIFRMFWMAAQSSLLLALWFTGLINVNLAIINLLPIPFLDGGHIIFSCCEVVTRRPLSAKVTDTLTNVFATLLIALFILLSIRDVQRFILPIFGKSPAPPSAQSASSNKADATKH